MQNECIFCRIATRDIPAQVVYENDTVLAFVDNSPVAPIHVLIIPKQHTDNVLMADSDVLAQMMAAVPLIATQLGVANDGFRLVVNTKEHGGQTVNHLHIHLLAGRSMLWPPG